MIKTTKDMSLYSAAVSALLAILVLSYATYAWFDMGRGVLASGIQLGVIAPKDIEISFDEVNWDTAIVADLDALDTAGVLENGYIMPATSFTGFDGSVFETAYAKVSGESDENTKFQLATGIQDDDGYYIDIPLHFRTASDVDLNLKLVESLTEIGCVEGRPDEDIYKCARVAFLAEGKSANAVNTSVPLVLASGDNSTISVVQSIDGGGIATKIAPEYISFSGGFSEDPVVFVGRADYSSGETVHITSTVLRIWIEGEDAFCRSAAGGQSFAVKLAFEVV